MPSLIRVSVDRARNLHVLENSQVGDVSTDTYVEVRIGNNANRTRTCRKSLNPIWGEDMKFEVADDSLLQVSTQSFKECHINRLPKHYTRMAHFLCFMYVLFASFYLVIQIVII